MPVYILHPNNNDLLEKVEHIHQLLPIEGKFLYFSSIDTLVVADSLDLYHKDIFLQLRSLSLCGQFPIIERPNGFGKLESGQVTSWKSFYFGETAQQERLSIVQLVERMSRNL